MVRSDADALLRLACTMNLAVIVSKRINTTLQVGSGNATRLLKLQVNRWIETAEQAAYEQQSCRY